MAAADKATTRPAARRATGQPVAKNDESTSTGTRSAKPSAVSTGTARLVAHHTQFCAALDPRIGNCTALLVHIEP